MTKTPDPDRQAVIEVIKHPDGSGQTLMFWCPGCETHHGPVVRCAGGGWTWNGDVRSPTIQPSVLVQGTKPLTDAECARVLAGEAFEPVPLRCHSFVRDGRIEFLGDCTHALVGQVIAMEPLP